MNVTIPKTYAQLLAAVDAVDPVAYAKLRNRHDGPVTKLSPYISRGVITLPLVRDRLLARHTRKDCAKLLQELAWREYFQNVWWAKGEAIFSDLRFSRSDWRHYELVSALVTARTGVHVLDRAIHTLFDTGYMHNHLRMSVASVACNLAKAHWFEMGKWLYYHLYDGDLASNFCSWQWVAGTSVKKPYVTNQAVLNACSGEQEHVPWFTYDRELMLDQPVPTVMQASHANEYVCGYPTPDMTELPASTEMVAYTPWTLNPLFLSERQLPRILVIDTDWFGRFPVSERVMTFIIEQGRLVIPGLKVFVGSIAAGPFPNSTIVHYETHQTTHAWPGTGSPPARLHPTVSGYFPSFYRYWQAVTKTS